MIRRAPDLQLEILRWLFHIVDIETLRALRAYSQVRHLWKRPSGVRLTCAIEEQQLFIQDVIAFQVGKLANHPGITFGNITIMHIHIYPRRRLIQDFKNALGHLKIQDLTIFCAEVPTFMASVIATWVPSLSNLLILRIKFERDMSIVRIPFVDNQSSTQKSVIY